MPKPKPPGLLVKKGKARVWVNPKLTAELATYLAIHIVQNRRAIARVRRMRNVLDDGTETTNAKYFEHAAGYLTKMLGTLNHSYSTEDVEAAVALILRREDFTAETDPEPVTPPLPGM